ncbi:coiled-coil domain-containing protein 71L [Bombina bombina]|uniref:coiled-coil domain-containing protein 71L n=1 Tax=Bombina bombina TaxID=8345 RepID=UPI00235A8E5F|nr:coiled-coil domain-containing protein 71L [Bombina bombina]
MQEDKVVFSRSHLVFAGTKPLEDALEMFVPESKHFMNSDTELWNFLCSLKQDFSPVILRSKDVYGYSSCSSVVPDPNALSRKKPKEITPPKIPRQEPVKRKRRPARFSTKKRRQVRAGSAGVSEESGSCTSGGSGCSSPTPSDTQVVFTKGKTLEEMWKAAAPKLAKFPTIRVRDVSCPAKVAAARLRAQRILRVNLQPVVMVRRYPVILS